MLFCSMTRKVCIEGGSDRILQPSILSMTRKLCIEQGIDFGVLKAIALANQCADDCSEGCDCCNEGLATVDYSSHKIDDGLPAL